MSQFTQIGKPSGVSPPGETEGGEWIKEYREPIPLSTPDVRPSYGSRSVFAPEARTFASRGFSYTADGLLVGMMRLGWIGQNLCGRR